MKLRATALAVAVLTVAGLLAAASATPTAASTPSCPWVHSTASPDIRAGQVLAQMTLDEKLSMTHGSAVPGYAGVVASIPRLCIPALNLQDGGAGVVMGGTTAMPAPVAAAATWDPTVERNYGTVVGQEAKTKGVSVNLGPNVNLERDPRGGRVFENAGEDPYLSAAMATNYVQGVQAQGVMTDLKHLVANDTEQNRNNGNAIVDERTLNEMYYPAFKQAVQQGNAASIMAATSLVNGVHDNENPYLIKQTAKQDWGFDGFVVTDWDGARSTVNAANAELDLTMPSPGNFGQPLTDAVRSGQVGMPVLNDKVARLLTEEFAYGLFDNPAGSPSTDATSAAHSASAQQIAALGTVLLKNKANLLPLNSTGTPSVAVIGEAAKKAPVTGGGGSSHVPVAGSAVLTVADGIAARLGDQGTVAYNEGVHVPAVSDKLPAVPSAQLTSLDGQPGLTTQYFNNLDLSGTPALTRVEANLDDHYTDAPGPGVFPAGFSVRWQGYLTAPVTGTYTFSMANTGGVRMTLAGRPVFSDWAQYGPGVTAIHLTGGAKTPITVENYQPVNGATGPVAGTPTSPPSNGSITLGWQAPDTAAIAAAAAAAKQASVAVVVVNDDESEDGDRQNLTLPGAQDDLVQAVAAANPHTVVVLNTGGPVLMPWLSQVSGVLESWYGGQQNGAALASVLFGDIDPGGKLPQTWPTSVAQLPTADPSRYPGDVDVSTNTTNYHYSEGLDVGYRWYDAQHLTPLFPFGYGLSYSQFAFSNLRVSPSVATQSGPITVSATVTNIGKRSASDVAQLYVGMPAKAAEPPKQLKGFQRVTLGAGKSQRVNIVVAATDLQTWDSKAHAWTTTPGSYRIYVGDSSRSLPLQATYLLSQSTGARTVTAQAPTSLDPLHGSIVTTTITPGGTQPLTNAKVKLAVPAGWTAKALSPATYRSVPVSTKLQTSWLVTPAAGAQQRLWRLSASVTAANGFTVSRGLQVSVGALVSTKLATTATLLRAGSSINATLTLRNAADHPVTTTYAIAAAPGVSVTPQQANVSLPARGTVKTKLTVSVGQHATAGTIDLTGSVQLSGTSYPLDGVSLDLPLVLASVADGYNNTGISDNASPAAANFDGSGYSYSAQSLAGVGLVAGKPVTQGDLGFSWPAAAPGSADNVVAAGQRIAVGKQGSQLSFLGSANNGNGSGAGTISYTDGSTAPFTLTLTNWTPSTIQQGDVLVATAPQWNRPAGSSYPPDFAVSVYSNSVPIDPSKTVDYVTLPGTVSGDQAGTKLHIFDLTVQ